MSLFLNGSTNCTYLNTNTIHRLDLTRIVFFKVYYLFFDKQHRTFHEKQRWDQPNMDKQMALKRVGQTHACIRIKWPIWFSNTRQQTFTALRLCRGCNHFPVAMHAACIYPFIWFHPDKKARQRRFHFNAMFIRGLQYSSGYVCVFVEELDIHSVY